MKLLEKLRPTQKKNDKAEETLVPKEDLSNIDQFLDGSSLDDIYPFSWQENPSHIESGTNFIRVFTIVDYPQKKQGNWLGELKRKKGNITVTQYLEPANSENMVRFYNDTIKNKEAEMLNTLDPIQKKKIQREIDVANFQLDKYLSSESSYIYQYTYVFMQAQSMEGLEDLSSSVTKTLTKLQLKPLTPTKGMYQAFWSALPLGENLLKDYTYKESNTEAASSFFPFDDAEICDLNPVSQIEGINKDTNSLVAVNYQNTARTLNQNMVVIGKSGVGKSTYMVQKILRNFAKGIKQFIIDPENEYSRIVELLGGEVMHLSSNAKTKINPLEIFSSEIGDDDNVIKKDMEVLVKDKIQRVKGFFQVIKPDITQVEKALLDTVLRNCYINCGILKYDDIKGISSEQYPILTTVYEEVAKLK
ncbi:conjugal transfer protein, partial [Bacilli bacterium]